MKKFFILIFIFYTTLCFAQDVIKTADSLLLNADFLPALELLRKNENIVSSDQRILIKNREAEALIHLGEFEEAEKILKELQVGSSNDFYRGITLTNLGFLYLNQGRNDRALDVLKQAINLFENTGKANSIESAQALTYLGQVYKYTGKDNQAQEQLQMALHYRENLLKGNHELIAASYNDLGLAYAGIDNDKALDYYEKALQIYAAIHGKDHPKIAIASINTGFIYSNLELYGDAVNNFETALKIWERVYPKAHQTKAFALLNLGDTYQKMGNAKAAKGYYDRSLSMYRESYGNKHPEIAGVLNKLGNIELAAGNFDQGLDYYQQAIVANIPDFDNTDRNVNPPVNNYYNGNVLLYSLLLKAQGFEKRYFGKSLKLDDLINGLKTLQVCDLLIDKLRQQSTNESDKIGLGVIANEVYADGVRIANEIAENSIRQQPYLNLAFYFAEKSKSAVLLDAISDSDAKSFAGIPAETMEEEKNLKSAIALTSQKLSQKPDPEEEKYLRETAYNLNRTYEAFIKRLELQFPQYFDLKYNAASPSVAEVQKLLDSKTAVISYFIDEKNARLYILQITRKKFKITNHAIPKEFDKYITGLRNSLYFNEQRAYTLTASRLSSLLVPKISRNINRLLILPTGRLSIIPFETLLTKKADPKAGFKSLPYLVKKFSIGYEFSASLLIQKTKNKTSVSNRSILLCAPVTFPERDNLSELPGTESEVKEIAQLFASSNYTATTNLRAQANEGAVKNNNIKNYNLLHFATHGVVDENNPELSRIFLQPSSDAEDGNLFSGEIYNLQLNADLVTLSACQTGLGKISKGEGVIGLSRALVYAGAKNIIVSFWSVADESTAKLMTDFYKELLAGTHTNYGESLRQAKLKLITSEKYAAPFYWAPFILIGF
jgi:CHAT domain-containing protein/Tfp pilus assembly protein PilF